MVRPCRVQLAQDVPERQPRLRVEADGGLVEEEHARLVHERAGDHEALLLAAGECVDFGGLLVGDAEALQELAGAALASARPTPKYVAWKIRFSMAFRLRSGLGRCGTTPMRCARGHGIGGDAGAGYDALPRGGAHAGGEDADGGGLPGPVRPEEAEQLPFFDAEVEALERQDVPVRLSKRGGLDGRHAANFTLSLMKYTVVTTMELPSSARAVLTGSST